jgi:hypothetical protein
VHPSLAFSISYSSNGRSRHPSEEERCVSRKEWNRVTYDKIVKNNKDMMENLVRKGAMYGRGTCSTPKKQIAKEMRLQMLNHINLIQRISKLKRIKNKMEETATMLK